MLIFAIAKKIFTSFMHNMKLQTKNNNINFSGYDARRIKAFVMNNNYANIANEVKKIGEIENFNVLILENSSDGFVLKKDAFKYSKKQVDNLWTQDLWGIVNNTLLARDNLDDRTKIWRMLFNLIPNKTQLRKQEESGLNKLSQYVDLLYNFPVINKNGKQLVQLSTPDGIMEVDKSIHDEHLEIKRDYLCKLSKKCHIKGGNYFITKGADGKDELLIGQDELKNFDLEQLKEMFQTDKIHVIPQSDYHLDLFIRPLKDKKVLVADDEMMSKILTDGFNKIQNLILSKPQNEREQYKNVYINVGSYAQYFQKIISQNPLPKTNEVEEALIKGGYEPIRVPGRIFEILSDGKESYILKQLHNYINASVHVNDKGEVIYITNKSILDDTLKLTKEIQEETGFSLEKAFKDAISPYVDKIYFVSGEDNAIGKELLPEYFGGIHCMTMEVPD